MITIPSLGFKDGRSIPQFGAGMWQIPDNETAAAVVAAAGMGYRLFDGAFIYGNEAGMGEGLRRSGVPRGELFVTTKVWNSEQGYDKTRAAVDASLERIGLDYLDLCLIHWPCPSRDLYVQTWKALIDVRDEGLIRSIGVSNFNPDHLDRLTAETGESPVLNQIEVNPRLQNTALRAENAERGIVTQAWTPLGEGKSFAAPEITKIAGRLGRSPAQVILRWHIQNGVSVIPRSTKPDHIADNLAALEFELTEADMAAISGLDEAARCGPDPKTFEED